MNESFIGQDNLYVISERPVEEEYSSAILFVHGEFGASWMWKRYMNFFVSQGWNVYALDLRGHGQSGGHIDGATMQDYADDVKDVMAELELTKPFLVGHGMGGLVCMIAATQEKTKGVVMLNGSPTAKAQQEGPRVTYPDVYAPMDEGMPETMEDALRTFPDMTEEQLIELRELVGKESGTAHTERQQGIEVPKESMKRTPLLFIAGEKNSTLAGGDAESSKRMRRIYGGSVKIIKDATHPGLLMGEHWEEAVKDLEKWLQKQK